ncbi:MAG: hypothetical protein R2728_03615 [Chitinophagales bacterium]
MNFGIGTKVTHPKFGNGVIIENEHPDAYEIYFREHGEKEISKNFDGLILVRVAEKDEDSVSFEMIKETLESIVQPLVETTKHVELGEKWIGGKLIMEPGREGLQSKELPIDVFWHKIVMTRDRIRVMEQKINSSNLEESEKLDLQQYITRIYGTFTTFNVLFEKKEDHFKGVKS